MKLSFLLIFAWSGLVAAQEVDSAWVSTHYQKRVFSIPMRDGVRLCTIAYIPRDTSKKYPILLQRTPYNIAPYDDKEFPADVSIFWRNYFREGYIVVRQDVRGRYMSEGQFMDVRPYNPVKKSKRDVDESSDAFDTVEWLVKNIPANNGRVGVKGISYPGFYSTMATIDAHPAVKATSPQAPVSQWMSGDDFFHNGAFMLPHAFDFYGAFGRPRPHPKSEKDVEFEHGMPDGYKFFLELGALPNANVVYFKDSVFFWNEIMAHGVWSDFWAKRSVLPHLKNLKPATLIVGGWFDTENLYGALHSHAEIEKNNRSGYHGIVMGPWYHGQWGSHDGDSLGYISYGSKTSEFYADSIELPFFNHYLKDSPWVSNEAVVFRTGENRWEILNAWPPQETDVRKYYFCREGRLSIDEKEMDGAADEYTNDPDKPVPYTNEITQWYDKEFMLEDQRFASRRPDVIVYQTDLLADEVTIAGPIKVHLTGSTSGTDCDWIVKVIDVFPDTLQTPFEYQDRVKLGGYQMLVRGDVLRGKFRNSLAAPEAIKPGEPTVFEYSLQDVFHTFRKGHRVMVQVQSSWFPMIDRNPGKFMNIYEASDADYQKTRQKIYHNREHPSFIEVNLWKP